MKTADSSVRPEAVSRRSFLRSASASVLAAGSPFLFPRALMGEGYQESAAANSDHGRIRPSRPVPDVQLLRSDGARMSLPLLTEGHATAVQMMFTTCTTTCPIQAAIFQRVQGMLPDMASAKIQLLSLSVDPDDNNAHMLAEWRQRFHAGPSWLAAAPAPADTARIQQFFGVQSGNFASHSTQVNLIDRQGRVVWRTNQLPTPEEIASILRKL